MSDALRTGLASTSDARAIGTRRRLTQAYIRAAEIPGDPISVVALCRLAGVGRSTFYAHFATVEDLAVSIVIDVFREMAPLDVSRRAAPDLDRSEVTRLGVTQLIDRLWAVRVPLLYAMGLPAGPAMQKRLVEEVVATTRGTVLAEQPELSEAGVALATNFIAAGVIQVVLTWLGSPITPREDLVESLLSLLPAWMT